MRKLSQREKRTLKMGAVCAAAIVVFMFATEWLGHWGRVRNSLKKMKAQLEVLDGGTAKQAGLMSIVPVFEMPKEQEQQKLLFRNKLNEQLKKVGIKSKPLQVLSGGRTQVAGYKLLRLKCSGKCKFGQVLDLLAGLNENPYLVGVEELQIRTDPKKPQEVELDLTVSTLTR